MRTSTRLLLAAGLALAALAGAAPAAAQSCDQLRPLAQPWETSTLVIETARGNRYDFDVELAVTPEQQSRGLMCREELAADAGMLFVSDTVGPQAFWMKNTLIPLDMLFIGPDGRIINIAERAVPLDTTIGRYVSEGPAKAVLEIKGGMSDFLGIAPGDRVLHPLVEGP